MTAQGDSQSGRIVSVLVLAAAIGLAAFNLVRCWSCADDAYISFRYLDNWLSGDGLVYNAGEYVEGYTNLLWILLLAPLRATGLSPEVCAAVLSLLCLGLLLFAVRSAAAAIGGRGAGLGALVLACGSVQLACWTGSGMETVCFAALLAAANAVSIRGGRVTTGAAVLFGLAVLTRPPGLSFALVSFALTAWFSLREAKGAWRRLLVPALIFAAFPAAQLLFRLVYYGDWLPNTFYAKLTGGIPSLVGPGWSYLAGFFVAGGAVPLLLAVFAVGMQTRSARFFWVLAIQAILHMAYVVRVGGDYFPYHRFLVPVLPMLVTLAALGLGRVLGRFGTAPALFAALACAVVQTGLGMVSQAEADLEQVVVTRAERELVAARLGAELPGDAVLAVNAAGLIPYRTGLAAIDMLGLTDRHIGRSEVEVDSQGGAFVGHYKHDGDYVFARRPDAVLTSGGRLHVGRSPEEAMLQAAVNTFVSDREFLRAAGDSYVATAAELRPGRYLVVHRPRGSAQDPALARGAPTSAEGWFHHGVQLMQSARLEEALAAFRSSLALGPPNPTVLTNIGFCLADLNRHTQALTAFRQALEVEASYVDALFGLAASTQALGRKDDAVRLWERYLRVAPDSVWKEKARQRLRSLRSGR